MYVCVLHKCAPERYIFSWKLAKSCDGQVIFYIYREPSALCRFAKICLAFGARKFAKIKFEMLHCKTPNCYSALKQSIIARFARQHNVRGIYCAVLACGVHLCVCVWKSNKFWYGSVLWIICERVWLSFLFYEFNPYGHLVCRSSGSLEGTTVVVHFNSF